MVLIFKNQKGHQIVDGDWQYGVLDFRLALRNR